MRKAVIIFIVAMLAVPAFAKAKPLLKAGSPAPSLILPYLSGKTAKLKDFSGKDVTILGFFASWSKSCKQEIDFLKNLAKEYKNKNLNIVGVSFDRNKKKLKDYIEKNKIKFDVLHDKKLKTLKKFRILIIPTLFVIDKDGKIANIYVDFDENVKAAVSKEIKKLLAPPKKK